MEKIILPKIDETIYKEVLDNGLTIFIYKKPGFQKKYAYFQTKYGSINNVFVPYGKKEYRTVPLGIAHFLEHKLFESNEDESIFEAFEKDGAYVNAATSYNKTYYYFNTVDNFDSCLIRLIDFVQTPYFTDENVEKEKGIIHQEIDMRNDNPDGFMYKTLVENALVKSQYRYDIGGTKEDVSKITKEDLYECYNTFYHPSNMYLVIAGDIDVKKTIKLIKDNQSKKTYKKTQEIKQKTFKEPNKIGKKEDKKHHNVTSKRVGFAYKMNFDLETDEEKYKFSSYLNCFFRILFGETSDFEENLIKEGIVKSYLGSFMQRYDNDNTTYLIFFEADTDDEELLRKKIEEKLKDRANFKKMFELYKKLLIASFVRKFESIEMCVSYIRTFGIDYDLLDKYYDIINDSNYEEFIKTIDKLNFDNYTKLILDKKEK